MSNRHFISLLDLTSDELKALIAHAIDVKRRLKQGISHTPLQGKLLAMIFEKSSTRTRVSFEAGMYQLGGHAIFMSPRDSHLGRGEPIEDSARVISSMVDGILIRTFGHERVESMAQHSCKPVINGLSDLLHPCQVLADMQTWIEQRGDIAGASVAWIGDGNNMCHSYINAAIRFGFNLRIGCPAGHEPNDELVRSGGDRISLHESAMAAAQDVDLVVTDVWASMGQEDEQEQRLKSFASFQVNSAVMQAAQADALFMHCLPAHRDEEVSTEVLESPQSVVWQEAENRLHAQKALLEFLLAGSI
ncbi:MAG: ornithine carbamoyltransferase [Gammaproteobacteria bacterium]|jgi:ornithine carbamoyltransferase|nr:ornithine carbamoyltransferase [Gammaproteobacteria bacterium]